MTNIHELPPLFRGSEFIDLPDDLLATLDHGAAERLDAVRTAYAASKAADDAIVTLKSRIEERVARLRELENFRATRFPKPGFMDLWREAKEARLRG